MTAAMPEKSLEDIRREIDAIDDRLLDLVLQRFAATGRVRSAKTHDGTIASSPLRPAREATMLRRLMAGVQGRIAPQLLVRLWRVILSASTQAQAPIILHVDAALGKDLDQRIRIAEHFCGMEVRVHNSTAEVFAALGKSRGDLALAVPPSDWADSLSVAAAAGVQLIGGLPVLADGAAPQLLVFGHATPQPSGHDETIVLSKDGLPAGTAPNTLWSARSGAWTVISLPGFLFADAPPPVGAVIAGRYPSPIEVNS